ncbi:MAG: M14 family zinc carboxypeptidase [Salinivirgaceae bacterium]|nr:M14 family zinc carboxypeptidase [Salinivirgaceae bacterium]
MRIINLIILGSLIALAGCNTGQKSSIQPTVFEQSNGTRTASYAQTIEYCNKTAKKSSKIKYIPIGKTPQNRIIPLLIIDSKENFTHHKVKQSGNAILLIQANIHPGEPDGNDAGMLLINKMITENNFPKNVTILFLPIVNPDGLARFGAYNRINQDGPKEMGWRVTAQNYNLNRDYVKVDAPEMKYWLKLYNKWLPDFSIDCHVTDGADYQYILTYLIETLGNMNAAQTTWQKEYITTMEQNLMSVNIPMHRYVTFRKWHDPRSGLYTEPAAPRYTQGYAAVQNRPGILLEAHSLKPFPIRVKAMLALFNETIAYLEKNSKKLIELNKKADQEAIELYSKGEPFPLTYSTINECDTVDFLGVEYDIVKSDLTDGDWFKYYPDKPTTFRLPYYNKIKSEIMADIPAAYIVGPEWQFIKRGLDIHNIEYFKVREETDIVASTWQCTNPMWSSTPFEGHFLLRNVILNKISKQQKWPAKSIVIPTNQRRARLIIHMFDPNSPDSYFRNGFFNSIFERKEYYETYVMERIAREMIDSIPELKQKFIAWRDAQESKPDQYEQLGWFYEQSPYFNYKRNLYPISTLTNEQLSDLKSRIKREKKN